MPYPECFYRISIKWLITDEQWRFLLCKEHNNLRELPGGGLDHGEEMKTCLAREIHEEMWLTVTHIEDNPSYILTCNDDEEQGFWRMNIIYHIQVEDLNFTPSDECVEIWFFDIEKARQLDTYSNVTTRLEQLSATN